MQLNTVYRGQKITQKELNYMKRNINGYILVNTFFSTTTSYAVASIYAGDRSTESYLECVLFIIHLNGTNQTRKVQAPFGSVKELSEIPDEDEVLFVPGTIFQINSVKKHAQHFWLVNLTVYDAEKQVFNDLNRYAQLILLLAKNKQINLAQNSYRRSIIDTSTAKLD